ncbi:MAG: hypothetical protein HXY49_06760 [Ignavibacteriaceae bacterium]|nr:hypothetical protein [Ignavibacteriaceae bacterium]
MRQKLFLITVLIIGFNWPLFSQFTSVNAFLDYSYSSSKRLEVTNADAVGGMVKLKFKIFDELFLTLNSGYKLYSLNEPDVLNNWDWEFWTDRYYNKIVSDLNADPNLSVLIQAIQKMDLIPLYLNAEYAFEVMDKFTIIPTAGGGVYFYSRRMFAEETWTKKFPEVDYSFTYTFRNFAPNKKGNLFFVNGGLDVEYKIFDAFSLIAGGQYFYVLSSEGKSGYDQFPLRNEISFKLGLGINY